MGKCGPHASLFRRFTHTNVYIWEPVALKYGKLATEYPDISYSAAATQHARGVGALATCGNERTTM